MSFLKQYVDQLNSWNKLTKRPLLSINRPSDRREIHERLLGDLSPENLSCDGELSGKALDEKAKRLNRALAELAMRDAR